MVTLPQALPEQFAARATRLGRNLEDLVTELVGRAAK